MRVVCISDVHGKLPVIEPCDLLLIGGDITPVSDHSPGFQRFWLETSFRNWLMEVPARNVVAVAGNHDFVFETNPSWIPRDLRWIYLQDRGVEIEGMKIYGTPWQPWFCDWAFNSPRVDPELFLAEKFAAIPVETDILLTHGAPFGYGDLAPGGDSSVGEHVGSTALLQRIQSVSPSLVVFGHLHGGYGLYEIEGNRGKITLANVAIMDEGYQPANRPTEFEISTLPGGLSILPIG